MNERSHIRRHPERAVPEEAGRILAEGAVAHLGFCQDGQPFVIPLAYHYDPGTPDHLYLHGATASRAMRHLGAGAPACAAVTLLDGLVYSRTAIYHSMNYRSVVVFGTARPVTEDAEKDAILERMIRRYFPGRAAGKDYDAPPLEHLRGTAVVDLLIEEWSAKARRGGPAGPLDADPGARGTAGVIPLREGG